MFLNKHRGMVASKKPIPTTSLNLHSDVIAYRDRIIAKGSTISNSDLSALDTWARTIIDANLKSLFLAFYPYAGNDWISAREALWVPNGAPTQLALVGTNFTSSNYTRITGFAGDGTQGFSTGFSFNGASNWSYSVYLRTSGNNSVQIGTGSGDSDYLAQNFSGISYYSNSSGHIDGTFQGWYTAQYSNLLRNGVLLHTNTNVNSGIVASNQNTYIHGRNNQGALFQGTNRSIGCVAVSTTKTPAQDLTIYNAVQTLMTAFGRSV
jgi:hypothetical protein